MPSLTATLPLAEALERAYRLALAVETLAAQPTPTAHDTALSAVAAELLGVLDHARASMVRQDTHPRTGW